MTAQTSHNRQNHHPGPNGAYAGVVALTALQGTGSPVLPAPVDVLVETSMGRVVFTTEHGDTLDFDAGELAAAIGVDVEARGFGRVAA